MPEQPCALRALSDPDDHSSECLALPCACDAAREQELSDRGAPSLRMIERWAAADLITITEAIDYCRTRFER